MVSSSIKVFLTILSYLLNLICLLFNFKEKTRAGTRGMCSKLLSNSAASSDWIDDTKQADKKKIFIFKTVCSTPRAD